VCVQIRRRVDPKQISALPEKFLPVHHLLLHDGRRAVSSPTAAGYRLGKSAKMHANPEDEHGRCRNDAEAMHCD